MLQRAEVCGSVLLCVAVGYSALHRDAVNTLAAQLHLHAVVA